MSTAVLPAAPATAPVPARPSRPAADGDAFEQVLRSQAEPTDAADTAGVDPAGDETRDTGSDQPEDPAAVVVPEPTPEPVAAVPVLPLVAQLPAAVTLPADGPESTNVSVLVAGAAVTPPADGPESTNVSVVVAGEAAERPEPTNVSAVITGAGAGAAGSAVPQASPASTEALTTPTADAAAPRPDASTTPLQAVAQPAATAPAAPVAPSAPAAPAAAPTPLHTQVVTAVSPLLTGPDGTHQLTVRLDPDGLGAVHVRLTVSGDEVRMHLVAADAATREALRDGLGQLRTQLEDVGLRATHLDVATDGDHRQQAGPGADDRHRSSGGPDRPGTRHGPAPPAAAQLPAPTHHRPDTRLDLRI